MALYIRIGTSHDEIETVRVSRRGSDHGTDAETWYQYGVHRITQGREIEVAQIEHKFGDGAVELAIKALIAVHAFIVTDA